MGLHHLYRAEHGVERVADLVEDERRHLIPRLQRAPCLRHVDLALVPQRLRLPPVALLTNITN